VRLTTVADAEAAAQRCAEVLAREVQAAVRQRGVAHLALSGGSVRRCYELLANEVNDWSTVHVWWSDERCVPPEHEDSNYRLTREALLDRLAVPAAAVHRMRGELGPDDGAAAYAAEMAEHLPPGDAGVPVLDVVHLGMGPDGHTASLFPGFPQVEERSAWCVGVRDAPKPPPERITVTFPVLWAARRCVLLAMGAEKAEALGRVRAGEDPAIPASRLRRDRLELIVDEAAAGGLRDG
jgi:6-phosphogluconolactonase